MFAHQLFDFLGGMISNNGHTDDMSRLVREIERSSVTWDIELNNTLEREYNRAVAER